mmetsp:Transcript_1989/g.4491  ORF Transcript_1989/g.4491 Transcript_1989/m.4491 type:complete len:302 (+) Transcript_1989:837-1742(+)
MEGIVENLGKRGRRRNVVGNSSNWNLLSRSSVNILPLSEQTNQNVGRSTVVQELGDKVQVGNQSSLQNDRHVGSVEQLDGVGSLLSTVLLVLDRKFDSPSLEVNNNHKDDDSCHQVCHVGKVLTGKGLSECRDLVLSGNKQVEESNDSTFEFSSTTSVEGGRRKGLPDNGLANVGGNEKRNTRTKSVSLLQEFIKSQDNQTGAEELGNDQNSVTGTNGTNVTIHSRNNVSNGFTSCDKDTEQLLSTREESTIFLNVVVDLNNTGTGKKLHDQTRSNNGTDTKFHQSSTVRSKDNSHPVERI